MSSTDQDADADAKAAGEGHLRELVTILLQAAGDERLPEWERRELGDGALDALLELDGGAMTEERHVAMISELADLAMRCLGGAQP